jgi:hypothetical protein
MVGSRSARPRSGKGGWPTTLTARKTAISLVAAFALFGGHWSLVPSTQVAPADAADPCDLAPAHVPCNEDWMAEIQDQIADRPMTQFVFPGAHNAGTWWYLFNSNQRG